MPAGTKYRLIIVTLFVLALSKLPAQNSLNFFTVDSTSYMLYMEKKWDELDIYCRLAITSGYDYYYLRMRAGIANYEQKKYRGAIKHFKKALDFNTDDETALEYLYYTHVYAGQYEEARWLSRHFNTELAKRLKTDRLKPVDMVTLEGGTKISDTSNAFKNPVYTQFGLNHYLFNRASLFHALSFYSQTENRFSVSQWQYYLSSAIPFKGGWLLSPGVHLLHSTSHFKRYDSVATGVTFAPYTYYLDSVTAQTTQLVAALNISKHTALFDFNFGAAANFMYNGNQYQLNGGIICYPFKSNRFYFGSGICLHSEDTLKTFNPAYSPFISITPFKRFTIVAANLSNKGANFAELNAYLVNNSIDRSPSRWVIIPSYSLSDKFHIYSVVGYETKREKTKDFEYHYGIFLLGLKYTPF